MVRDLNKERLDHLSEIRFYTIKEIEPILGLTGRTLRDYIKNGKLKAIKIGNKWMVSEDNLKKFINGD